MKRALISLFVAFSVLAAPIAHAAKDECDSYNTPLAKQESAHQDSKKQESTKSDKAVHHCCCSHVSTQLHANLGALKMTTSQAVASTDETVMRSVVVGPPLKPPSHA